MHVYPLISLEIRLLIYSNGLAPDNLFFHGVACNCVKIQLSHLGLETEFAQCEIQVDEKDWEGVRRKYWHGRNKILNNKKRIQWHFSEKIRNFSLFFHFLLVF